MAQGSTSVEAQRTKSAQTFPSFFMKTPENAQKTQVEKRMEKRLKTGGICYCMCAPRDVFITKPLTMKFGGQEVSHIISPHRAKSCFQTVGFSALLNKPCRANILNVR